jgi:hypothetical protein
MLGSILIQPQMFARMQGRSDAEELGDELLALVHRILLDPAASGAVIPAAKAAGEAMGQRLFALVEARLPQGLAALQALFAPALARITALGQGGPDATAMTLRLADLLESLAGSTGNLSDESIRAFVRRVFAVARDDFGLSTKTLALELRAFVADFRERLVADEAAGQRETRVALACALARIDRDLIARMPEVSFDADLIASFVIAELRRTGLAEVRDQAGCVLGKLQAVLRAVADLARTVAASGALPRGAPPRSAAPRSRRRAPAARSVPNTGFVFQRDQDEKFCWYASWLYATRRQGSGTGTPDGHVFLQTITPGYPEDEVWLTKQFNGRQQLVLRRAVGDDEVLSEREDSTFEWHQAAQFSGNTPVSPLGVTSHAEYFTFPRLSHGFLETWAQVTAALADAAAAVWHAAAALTSNDRELACNVPLVVWKLTQMASAIDGVPLFSRIAQKADWGVGGKFVFSPSVSMLMVLLGSLEGIHTKTNAGNGFLQWLTLLGGDALSAFKIHVITQAARSISLSVFTMINYEGPLRAPGEGDADTRPRNWDMSGPWVGLVNTLLGMAFIKIMRREDHGLPIGGNTGPFFLWFLIGAPTMAFLGTLTGVISSWAWVRTITPDQLWKDPLKAAAVGTLTWLVTMYTSTEGDTGGGTYNATVDPQGNTFSPPRLPFAGYAPNASSPYRLPYPAPGTMYVGQANQGFFSHMRYGGTVQVYAYDFAHDFGDDILACRGGTVVDWFDFYPDDTELDLSATTNPDFATALAAAAQAQTDGFLQAGQTGFAGALTGNWNFVLIRHDTQDGTHDRDQGGATVFTFAEYGHGRTGGVRAAFAERGIAPASIIGTVVQQGEVIMKAGDTGVSFHNHLHLHVRAATSAAQGTQAPPVRTDGLSAYTIPFVFREGDGPLKHLTWYRSSNVKI